MSAHVYVLANDVVPGAGMPVAAPGLRAAGLAEGLAAHQVAVTLVSPVGRGPSPWRSPVPAPSQPDVAVVRPVDVREFFTNRAPATVIITNSNQYERVADIEGLRLVFDMFAPKVLELECGRPPAPPENIARLSERKRAALAGSAAFIVNGAKKRPYLDQWLTSAGVDPESALVATVNMAVVGERDPLWASTVPPVRLLLAGYQQPWSAPGAWLDVVHEQLSADLRLSVVRPRHWGSRGAGPGQGDGAVDAEWIEHRGATTFDEFTEMVAHHDVVLDLFDDSPERRLAMVTRTVVALACGTPVVHPPWTEVSPLIDEFDAGWLVEPDDHDGLTRLLDEITANPAAVVAKRPNALRLAAAYFAPSVAAESLVELLDTLHGATP